MNNDERVYDSDGLTLELFDYLYHVTYKSVYFTISRYINNESTILDLLQDTYISSFIKFECLGTFSVEGYQRWVNRIATNKAKDYLKRKKPALFSELSYPNSEFDAEDLSKRYSPEDYAQRKELTELFDYVLGCLPKDQRECIFLYYYEDMRICEIAKYLGITESTVKSRLRYGKEKMKLKLEESEKNGFRLFSLTPGSMVLYIVKHKQPKRHFKHEDVFQLIQTLCTLLAVVGMIMSLMLPFGIMKPSQKNISTVSFTNTYLPRFMRCSNMKFASIK
ncbi:hypothetical protein AOC36_09055 [Erysipelothrix larvae]|uniref:RNA polymerase sigma factor 70 region 4 type 2 domain-containing protein n=1 Tax=Erysipelothrix larvae TaxID=1514105 RepID=A0A0X8H152_9FIRM|nr:RNA polymerase sigma factor [Erysipelothrix larvae]AMC94131.1 hypothetical protein AOC36_09055 [Erysipelothrix larvae]